MNNKKLLKLTNNMMLLFPMYNKSIMRREGNCNSASLFNPKFRILGILVFHGPMQMSELSQRLCVSKPNVTALIRKLIEEKMVKRSYDDTDRRIINISITSLGEQYLLRCRDEVKSNIKNNISILQRKDIERLFEASEDMMDILSKINNDDKMARLRRRLEN